MDILYAAQRALLDCYGPPAVVVNAEGDIVYVSGRTGKYLEPASGKVNINVFAMAREGLREELGVAIRNAAARKTSFTVRGVTVKSNGGSTTLNLTVRPLAEPAALRGLLLVVFEETAGGRPQGAAAKSPRRSTQRFRRRNWKRNFATPARAFRPPSKKCRPRRRNSARRMRSCSPTTRNCRAPTRNSTVPRRNCSRSTRKCRRSTPSCSPRWRSCRSPTAT